MQDIIRDHMMMIRKFPHREPQMPEEAGITLHDGVAGGRQCVLSRRQVSLPTRGSR